jgi:hypothetical protein
MRRKAQLLHAHPHLNVVPVRGNIDARLQMLRTGELDAIVLAAAGMCSSLSLCRSLSRALCWGRVRGLSPARVRQPGTPVIHVS